MLLPSSTTVNEVRIQYEKVWEKLSKATQEEVIIDTMPDKPLARMQFRRVWLSSFPTLRIYPRGSDFCDKCVELKDQISGATGDEKHQTRVVHRTPTIPLGEPSRRKSAHSSRFRGEDSLAYHVTSTRPASFRNATAIWFVRNIVHQPEHELHLWAPWRVLAGEKRCYNST